MRYWIQVTLFSIAMVIVFAIAGLVGAEAHGEVAAPEGFYPLTGKIIEINSVEDYFIVVDGSGFLWKIGEVEDFAIGDFVSMIMWDAGTPTITDDEIAVYVYAGKEGW